MAKVYSGEEILQKVSTLTIRRTNVTDRQTDRQTCHSKDLNVMFG